MYLTPFDDYRDFVERQAPPECRDPLAWTTTRDFQGVRIQIAGINSAWSSFYPIQAGADSDDRRLLIGASQVPDADPEADYRILLLHHPFDWLNREVCSRVEQRIRRLFDIIMFGHVHSPRDLGLLTTPGANCLLVPSPLLYNRPYEDSIEFARGLLVGSLDVATGQCEVFYYRYTDAYGPKLVPYLDLYRSGHDRFISQLRPTAHASTASFHVADTLTSKLPDVALANDAAIPFRAHFNSSDSIGTLTVHCLQTFAKLVGIQTAKAMIVSPVHVGSAILAYLAAELTVVRALAERFGGVGRQRADAASRTFLQSRGMFPTVSDADFRMLITLLDGTSSSSTDRPSKFGLTADMQASLLFTILWALGRYALVLDQPKVRWTPSDQEDVVNGPGNVIDIRSTEDSVAVVRVATTTRDGFYAIAEARHEVDEYVAEVEDLWRRAGLIAPPITIRVEFPMWRRRSLESYHLQIDAKPIARLLMGKALYGSREHVWIRELAQNALDATEMRRTTLAERDYAGSVGIRWVTANLVEIDDNGVGMDHQHIIKYLATLGRSGWRESDPRAGGVVDASFFGRFGIGFASVFSVASAVHVKTRRAGSRSVDGLSVQFSDPERPFFVEPLVCTEGTSITIRLIDPLPSTSFRQGIRDLFVYLPESVRVEPDTGIPERLEDVSILTKYPDRFDAEQTVTSVEAVTLGPHHARLKVELTIPPARVRRATEGENRKIPPATGLTLSVSGVRIFEQEGLRLDKSGRPKAEVDWQWSRSRDFGLKNCFATLDFDRETSPVRPSRDAIDVDATFADELRSAIERVVAKLIPDLLDKVGVDDGPEARRVFFIRTLDAISRQPASWEVAGHVDYSAQLLTRIASLYADRCPVILRTDKGARLLKKLGEIDAGVCSTAVIERVTETSAFSVYARASGLHCWLVLSDSLELGVLQAAWPFRTALKVLASASNLFQRHDIILPELRSTKLCKLLRGDYALSNSPVFDQALFVHLPGNVQSVARHVGAARRRSQMDPSQAPRVVLNSEHELTVGLENFLLRADDRHVQQLGTWLDSFCDGVIEDKTKLAPTARWNRLIDELNDLTGIDLRGTSIEKLRLTV